MTNVKREIFAHAKLTQSSCILKLEDVFEHQKELFLIYEMGELLEDNFMISDLVKDKNKLDCMLGQLLIAVNEINSLKLAVCIIHRDVMVKTVSGDYKLFNFINLNHYDQLKDHINSEQPMFIEINKIKVGP